MKQQFISSPGKRLIFLALSLLPAISHAQITFQKSYHQPNKTVNSVPISFGMERVTAIAQDKNGTNDYYFVANYTESQQINGVAHNFTNGSIVKTNVRGEVQWSKTLYANTTTQEGGFVDIKCTYNQAAGNTTTGLIAAGNLADGITPVPKGFNLATLNLSGNITQAANYNLSTDPTMCNKVQQTFDASGVPDGFIAVGFSGNSTEKVVLVRTNTNLNPVWTKTYSINGSKSRGNSVRQTDDKGFILTGSIDDKMLVIKTNSSGGITWQKVYSNSTKLTGADIVENIVTVGTNRIPEYYVAANDNDDIIIMKLTDVGNILEKKAQQLPGSTEKATGITYAGGGHVTYSGTTGNQPMLGKLDPTTNNVAFAEKYINTIDCSPLTATTDNGYIVGGRTNIINHYYLIKTKDDGISDCRDHEQALTPMSNSVSISAAAGTFVAGAGPILSPMSHNIDRIDLQQTVVCRDFCKNSTLPTPSVEDVHTCYESTKTLEMNCSTGGNVQWFKVPDYTTPVGLGNTFTTPTLTTNNIYAARCYNEDGCVVEEHQFRMILSTPPTGTLEPVSACFGQSITLTAPCGITQSFQWLNPAGWTSASFTTTANTNEQFEVSCIDEYGCIIGTHIFDVQVVPSVVTNHELCIAPGAPPYLLPFTCAAGTNLEWTDHLGATYSGSPVTISAAGIYSIRCIDPASNCPTRTAVFNVNPDPECSQVVDCFQPGKLLSPLMPAGTTPQVEKNGVSNGTNMYHDGPGSYVIKFYDASGNLLATYNVYLHNCDGGADKPAGADGPAIDIARNSIRGMTVDVYPNPSEGVFNIKVNVPEQTNYEIRVFDILGKEIATTHNASTAKDAVVDLSGYPKGVYSMHLKINGQSYVKRVVIR